MADEREVNDVAAPAPAERSERPERVERFDVVVQRRRPDVERGSDRRQAQRFESLGVDQLDRRIDDTSHRQTHTTHGGRGYTELVRTVTPLDRFT